MRAVPAPQRGAAGGSVTSVTGEGGHGLAGAFWPSLSASARDPAGVFRSGSGGANTIVALASGKPRSSGSRISPESGQVGLWGFGDQAFASTCRASARA